MAFDESDEALTVVSISHPYFRCMNPVILKMRNGHYMIKWRDFLTIKQDRDFATMQEARMFAANLLREPAAFSCSSGEFSEADCFWRELDAKLTQKALAGGKVSIG